MTHLSIVKNDMNCEVSLTTINYVAIFESYLPNLEIDLANFSRQTLLRWNAYDQWLESLKNNEITRF
jgi:hypothetical protein